MNKNKFLEFNKKIRREIIEMSIPNGGHISTSFHVLK